MAQPAMDRSNRVQNIATSVVLSCCCIYGGFLLFFATLGAGITTAK